MDATLEIVVIVQRSVNANTIIALGFYFIQELQLEGAKYKPDSFISRWP